MESKSALIKQLQDKDIPVPTKATLDELKHRLEHWKGGKGYLLRLALPSSRKGDGHPVAMLEFGNMYWIPNSRFAKIIVKSNLVYIVGMEYEPPASTVVLDVPKDFNDRWGIGVDNGSNE